MDAMERIRLTVAAIVGFTALGFVSMVLRKLWSALTPDVMQQVAREHFPVLTVPVTASSAVLVVMIFRSASGPLEFTGLGFTFKGAAGETVMWMLCFLALSGVIKLLY